jgi:hypothetical protein
MPANASEWREYLRTILRSDFGTKWRIRGRGWQMLMRRNRESECRQTAVIKSISPSATLEPAPEVLKPAGQFSALLSVLC